MNIDIIGNIEDRLNEKIKEEDEEKKKKAVDDAVNYLKDSARKVEDRLSDLHDDYRRLDDQLDKFGIKIEDLSSIRRAIKEITN